MGSVILFFLFFFVFRGFGYWDMGSVILFFLFFFGFSKFLIPLSRENRVICMARDGCTSDTGCIVQQMDAYMGFAGLKTVKKLHCHSVLFCYFLGGGWWGGFLSKSKSDLLFVRNTSL